MNRRCHRLLRLLAIAALFAVSGASRASITVYTDYESFMAAISVNTVIGTDTFNSFESTSGPVTRYAGSLLYTVDAAPDESLVRTGNSDDGWISAATKRNTLSFTQFSPGTFAAGAYFFGTTSDTPASQGLVVIRALAADQSAERQFTLSKRTDNFFVGFVSDAPLTSVTAKYLGGSGALIAVNDLTLSAPVSEPETYALLLSGLAVVGFVARRRRAP